MFALNLIEFVTLWQSTRSGARPYIITSQLKIRGSAVRPSRRSQPLGIPHLHNLRVINYT